MYILHGVFSTWASSLVVRYIVRACKRGRLVVAWVRFPAGPFFFLLLLPTYDNRDVMIFGIVRDERLLLTG